MKKWDFLAQTAHVLTMVPAGGKVMSAPSFPRFSFSALAFFHVLAEMSSSDPPHRTCSPRFPQRKRLLITTILFLLIVRYFLFSFNVHTFLSLFPERYRPLTRLSFCVCFLLVPAVLLCACVVCRGSYDDVSFLVDDGTAADVCPTIDIDVDVNGPEHQPEGSLEPDPTALTASAPEPLKEGSPSTDPPAVLGDETVRDDKDDETVCIDVGDDEDEDDDGEAACGGKGGEGTGRFSVEAESFVAEPAQAQAALAFLSPSRCGGCYGCS